MAIGFAFVICFCIFYFSVLSITLINYNKTHTEPTTNNYANLEGEQCFVKQIVKDNMFFVNDNDEMFVYIKSEDETFNINEKYFVIFDTKGTEQITDDEIVSVHGK